LHTRPRLATHPLPSPTRRSSDLPWVGPGAAGVSHSVARPDWTAERDAHRHQGNGDHELAVPQLHRVAGRHPVPPDRVIDRGPGRSEEHTSELQSLAYIVCRLLLD